MNLRLLILTIFLTFISIKSIYADETHICGEVLKSNNPVNHILNLTEQEAQQFYNYIEPDQVTEFLKAKEDETTVILENIFKNKNTFSNTLQPLITLQAQFEKIALIAKYHKSRSEEQLEEWENLYDWATQLQKYLWVDAIFNPDFKTRFLSLYKQKDTLNQYERVQVESVHSKILSHQQEIQKNPILADTGLDYGTFAFDKIGIEHFYPAMVSSYQYVVSEFDKLIENVETPTFDSLIRAYIDMKSDFEKVETVLDTYFNNNNKKAWKVKLSQLAERYQNFSTDLDDRIFTNELFYKKVKYIEQNEKLSENKKIYISKLLTYFDDSGISLQGNERAKFIALNKEQNALTIKFNNNVMAQLNLENFQVHVSDESELEGLPKRVITSAKEKADQLGIEGWVFGSSSENFFAIYDYAKSDALRKRFWIEYNSTNNKGDKFDNQEIVKRLVAIRHEMAKMLGYKNHAERMLVNRMAKTPEKVFQFLNDLADKSRTKATEEVQILQAYRAKITGDNSPFKPWEFRYWSQQYKKDHFNFDKEKLTPYFEITKSLDGIFKVAEKLYGLKFKYRNDLPTYDPTVKVVEVLRANNEKVGLMYVDLFEREGTKRDGAWMMPLISQSRTLQGERIPPVVSINANFAMASDGSSYLNFDNLTTLFHEFGHALHGLMSNVELKTQTGMSVKWDFVELPSQIMENFCYEMEALKLFAYNDDGELIPEEYIEALKKSDKFGGAFSMMSQLHRGALDMGYYTDLGENGIQDLLSLEQEATKNFQLLELTGLEKPYATSFQHIMVGGYQAGYYSYKWAEVLDADAFAAFEETGDIFNPTISSKFETLLSSGASKDEMQLFIDFRGREPSVDYLLRRTGIID